MNVHYVIKTQSSFLSHIHSTSRNRLWAYLSNRHDAIINTQTSSCKRCKNYAGSRGNTIRSPNRANRVN